VSAGGGRAGAKRVAATVAGGALLILAARAFNAPVLLVPGVAFVLVGTLAPLWAWLAMRRADVARTLGARRVVEGQPLEINLRLRRGWLWSPGAEVIDPVGGPMVVGGDREVRLIVSFDRRGRARLDPPRLRISDPLGLVEMTRTGSGGSDEVLVLPQTDPVGWLAHRGGSSGDTVRRSADDPWGASEVDGLRDYVPGTPASRIHWPALARGAGLLERRLRADAGALPAVVLDPRSDGRPDRLDAAVRAAASLVRELARRSGCELVLPGDRRPLRVGRDLAAWPEAHVRLALVEDAGDTAAPALPRLRGPIFYVAARAPGETLILPGARPGRQPFVLVLPRELAAAAPGAVRFSVAGCQGVWVAHQRARVAA
jgi:uncharacterized protein (DUF58 family)